MLLDVHNQCCSTAAEFVAERKSVFIAAKKNLEFFLKVYETNCIEYLAVLF